MAKSRLAVIAFFLNLISSHAAPAMDTIQRADVSLNGALIYQQTGQIVDDQTCNSVVTQNVADAPTFGFGVASGAFYDQASGLSVRQYCAPADPVFDKAPPHPVSVAPNVYEQPVAIPCPIPSARRLVLFVYGQSNSANFGETRYNASAHVFAYMNGRCFPAYDPLAGGDGFDGSPWGRLGDRILTTNLYDDVVIISAGIGGAQVGDWAPGGTYNSGLVARVKEALKNGMRPNMYIVVQGEGDVTTTFPPDTATFIDVRAFTYVPTVTRQSWHDTFLAGLRSIRSLDIVDPAYVAKVTRCNLRDVGNSSGPNFDKVVWRNPSFYIAKEKSRIEVRAGQDLVVNYSGVFPGPDIDILPPELSYDGCHRSRLGLDHSADLWLSAITGKQ